MKKIILFLIFSSNLCFCQEEDKDIYAKAGLPTPIDLPTQTELPSVSASIEKADMMMKGYSVSPPKPDFPKFPEWMHKLPPTLKDNSKEIEKVTERIRRNTAELEYINKLRRDSLLREINGGDTFQKIIDEQNSKIDVSGGWAKKSDVETQSPIEVSISDEHTNNSSNNLTLIFITFLIVGIIVFIIKKLKKNNQSIQFESNQSTLKENKNNKEVSNLNKTISIDNNIDTTFHQKQLQDFEKYNKIYSGEFEKLVLEETKFLNTKDEINRVLKFLENEELEYYDKCLKENIDWSKDYHYHKLIYKKVYLERLLDKIDYNNEQNIKKEEEILFFKNNPSTLQKLEWILSNIIFYKGKDLDYLLEISELGDSEESKFKILDKKKRNKREDEEYEKLRKKILDNRCLILKLGNSNESILDVINCYKQEISDIEKEKIASTEFNKFVTLCDLGDVRELLHFLNKLPRNSYFGLLKKLESGGVIIPNWIRLYLIDKEKINVLNELKNTITFNVKGVHIDSNLKNLYDTLILDRVTLMPEPTNEFDKNAIKVNIDGKKIGYIPASETQKFSKIIENEYFAFVTKKSTSGFVFAEVTVFS